MKHFPLILLFAFSSLSIAQEIDSVAVEKDSVVVKEQTAPPPSNPQSSENKWYYGGTIGFNFWSDYFYLSVNPIVGYKVSPKFSVGGKLLYSYYNYDEPDISTNNYGASIFARFRPIYQIYLHSEFAYESYEIPVYNSQNREWDSERNWVPFLLLGGGFVQRVGANASVYVEVLFDVIQDENSPYEDWDPIISIGGGVGF
ncbi:MAG: hypothetical protein MUC75_06190 [Ignavibacteriaceae bacterium]|jgi:hypothetical protein|nr:hypothetical protein [Ignavibacteriaceae bacterium]